MTVAFRLRRRIRSGCIIAAVTLIPFIAVARFVPTWLRDPEMIAKRSDLIVIGRLVTTVNAGAATNLVTSDVGGNFQDFEAAFVPVHSTFEVLATLKGSTKTNRVVLSHYR